MGTNVESRLSEMLPAQLGELSILERKVSTYLLKHEDKLMGMDISEIAKAAGVSKATVVRFCKALGFNGLKDFKIYYEAGKSQYATKLTKISKDVPALEVMNTMRNGFIRTIEKSSTDENFYALEKIADDIASVGKATILYSDERGYADIFSARLNSLGYSSKVYSCQEAISEDIAEGVIIILSQTGDIDGFGPYCKKAKGNGCKIESFTSTPKSWMAVNSDNSISLFNEKLLPEDKYILSNCAVIMLLETLYVLLEIKK